MQINEETVEIKLDCNKYTNICTVNILSSSNKYTNICTVNILSSQNFINLVNNMVTNIRKNDPKY
jgi:hypothetical protein